MRNKTLVTILSMALICATLTGCGKDNPNVETTTTTPTSTETTVSTSVVEEPIVEEPVVATPILLDSDYSDADIKVGDTVMLPDGTTHSIISEEDVDYFSDASVGNIYRTDYGLYKIILSAEDVPVGFDIGFDLSIENGYISDELTIERYIELIASKEKVSNYDGDMAYIPKEGVFDNVSPVLTGYETEELTGYVSVEENGKVVGKYMPLYYEYVYIASNGKNSQIVDIKDTKSQFAEGCVFWDEFENTYRYIFVQEYLDATEFLNETKDGYNNDYSLPLLEAILHPEISELWGTVYSDSYLKSMGN